MADDITPDPATEPATPEPATPDPTPDTPLGETGEKALQAWKERAKAAEKDAKRAAELEARLAEIEAANMSDQEKAIAEARKEAADAARSEVLTSTNSKMFRSELRAATASAQLTDAATKDLLINTDVAITLLGLDGVPVTEDGDIDSEAISQAVAAYVEARPYLAASATQQPGSIDQGPRTTTTTIKSIDDEIAEAEASGDYKTSGRLKTQKMLAAKGG